jgi:hypothetical protein
MLIIRKCETCNKVKTSIFYLIKDGYSKHCFDCRIYKCKLLITAMKKGHHVTNDKGMVQTIIPMYYQ